MAWPLSRIPGRVGGRLLDEQLCETGRRRDGRHRGRSRRPHTRDRARLRALAEDFKVFTTGSSDYHGSHKTVRLAPKLLIHNVCNRSSKHSGWTRYTQPRHAERLLGVPLPGESTPTAAVLCSGTAAMRRRSADGVSPRCNGGTVIILGLILLILGVVVGIAIWTSGHHPHRGRRNPGLARSGRPWRRWTSALLLIRGHARWAPSLSRWGFAVSTYASCCRTCRLRSKLARMFVCRVGWRPGLWSSRLGERLTCQRCCHRRFCRPAN